MNEYKYSVEPLVRLIKVGRPRRGRRIETGGYGEPSLPNFARISVDYVPIF